MSWTDPITSPRSGRPVHVDLPAMLLTKQDLQRHGFSKKAAAPQLQAHPGGKADKPRAATATHRSSGPGRWVNPASLPAPKAQPSRSREAQASAEVVQGHVARYEEYLSLRPRTAAPRKPLKYAGTHSARLSVASPREPQTSPRHGKKPAGVASRPAYTSMADIQDRQLRHGRGPRSGTSYRLPDSETRYRLPSRATMSPRDGLAGELSVWPAGEGSRVGDRSVVIEARRRVADSGQLPGSNRPPQPPSSGPSPRGDVAMVRQAFMARKHRIIKQPGTPGNTATGPLVLRKREAGEGPADLAQPSTASIASSSHVLEAVPGSGYGSKSKSMADTGARPQFLQQLEEFVEHELEVLGVSRDEPPSAMRLQVYQEAFQYFIEDFTTYKGFLAAVKNEYEALLEKYSQKLHYIPPLKARLSTLQQEAGHILNKAHKHHSEEKANLEEANAELRARVAELEEQQLSSAAEIARLAKAKEEAVGRAEKSRAATKGLIMAVRKAEEELKSSVENEERLSDEVFNLQNDLHRAKLAKDKLASELTTLQEASVGMVSAADAAALREQAASLQHDLEDARTSFLNLRREHSEMINTVKQLTARREAMEAERDRMKRIRQTTLARAPPRWMRRLATKLQVAVKWKTDRLVGGEERLQYADDFDPDELLSTLLRAIQKLKDTILQKDGRITDLRKQLQQAQAAERTAVAKALEQAKADQDNDDSDSDVAEMGESVRKLVKSLASKVVAKRQPVHYDRQDNTAVAELAVGPAGVGVQSKMAEPEFSDAVRVTSLKSRGQYFTGLGVGVNVPRFLRTNAQVRNRHLGKATTERLVKECWVAKQRLGQRVPLADFFSLFLKRRWPANGEALEMAYNVVDALHRYSYDSDLSVFMKILDGKLPEALHHEENLVMQKVSVACVALDREVHKGALLKKVPFSAFFAMLKSKCFPTKTGGQWKQLVKALRQDVDILEEEEGEELQIKYNLLFAETEQGDQGMFCEELREQHLQEFVEYRALIEERINAAVPLAAPGRVREVSVSMALEVLHALDPEKPQHDVAEMVARGFATPVETLTSGDTRVPLTTFFTRLFSGWIHRSTHPEASSLQVPPEISSEKMTRRASNFLQTMRVMQSFGSRRHGRRSSRNMNPATGPMSARSWVSSHTGSPNTTARSTSHGTDSPGGNSQTSLHRSTSDGGAAEARQAARVRRPSKRDLKIQPSLAAGGSAFAPLSSRSRGDGRSSLSNRRSSAGRVVAAVMSPPTSAGTQASVKGM